MGSVGGSGTPYPEGECARRNNSRANSKAKGARSDRQRDLAHEAGENEQAAQAVAVTLVRQEEAAEADEDGERHRDLASGIHVLFLLSFPHMTLARDDRLLSLPEAFVFGGMRVGEKQEQSKNKIGRPAKILARKLGDQLPRSSPPACRAKLGLQPARRRLMHGAHVLRGFLGVSSRRLLAHFYRVIRRLRYGTDSTWERHNDGAAVFGVKRLDGAMACGPLVWR